MSLDWKTELTIACTVRDAVRAADTKRLWQYYMPEVAATEEQIRTAERILGCPLDGQYREFLRYANGWRRVLQNIDIHGTSELISEEVRAHYADLLKATDRAVFLDLGLQRTDVYVIAGARIDGDMFCMAKPATAKSGQVFWIAGTVVDRFPGFEACFLSVVDYNRREIGLSS